MGATVKGHAAPVVIVRIWGGLGNQLFGYAAARRLALHNGAPLRLDARSGFERDRYGRRYLLDRFAMPCAIASDRESYRYRGGDARRVFDRLLNAHLPASWRWFWRQEAAVREEERFLALRVTRPLFLEGYWPSERYFADVADVIRRDLRLARPPSAPSQALAASMRHPGSISIHLRSFAEVPRKVSRTVVNTALEIAYYRRAIAWLAQRAPDPHLFLFSDDLEWAMRQLASPLPVTPVDVNVGRGDEGAVDDLWLISQCRHHIVSNSTFSWWGAWLGEQPDSLICAPQAMQNTRPGWAPARWIAL